MTYPSIADKVVLVTGTLYNPTQRMDAMRAQLALQTLRAAADIGYSAVVIDCGSPAVLTDEFRKTGAFVYSPGKLSMGENRREAIRQALGLEKEVIAFLEPEKTPYVSELWKTAKPILDGTADFVIPKRKSLESLPLVQQFSESCNNLILEKLTGVPLDMYFGPRTWRKDLSHYFLNYDGKYGDQWDVLFIPTIDAMLDGKRVISVEVDYTHPKEQTALEENDFAFYEKRLMQMKFVNGVIEHWHKRKAEQQHKVS